MIPPLKLQQVLVSVSSLALLAFAVGCGSKEAPSTELQEGTQYYVYVDSIEVHPNKSNGKSWDNDSSAPDVYYEVFWQGNRVFESSERKDTLVAEWKATEMGLGLGEENFLKGESSALAARVAAGVGTLKFEVVDSDVISDDPIGTLTVPVGDLKIGRNQFENVESIDKIVIVVEPIPPIKER